ncbi:unnamed protein product [Lampetra planeri]
MACSSFPRMCRAGNKCRGGGGGGGSGGGGRAPENRGPRHEDGSAPHTLHAAAADFECPGSERRYPLATRSLAHDDASSARGDLEDHAGRHGRTTERRRPRGPERAVAGREVRTRQP